MLVKENEQVTCAKHTFKINDAHQGFHSSAILPALKVRLQLASSFSPVVSFQLRKGTEDHGKLSEKAKEIRATEHSQKGKQTCTGPSIPDFCGQSPKLLFVMDVIATALGILPPTSSTCKLEGLQDTRTLATSFQQPQVRWSASRVAGSEEMAEDRSGSQTYCPQASLPTELIHLHFCN
jgi:hypothetical protein